MSGRQQARNPWSEWIPGVLGKSQVQALADEGLIQNFNSRGLDHSSFDLHLSGEVYKLKRGAIKPTGSSYEHVINPFRDKIQASDKDALGAEIFLLEPRRTYVVRLHERLVALQTSRIFGQATAKSSVGRVDVLARLVVDGMSGYEGFVPHTLGNGTGDLFLEITSMTFPIRIKSGSALSQLRLFYGPPSVSEIRGEELLKTVLRYGDCDCASGDASKSNEECALTADLSEAEVSNLKASAFSAKDPATSTPVDLWSSANQPSPCNFWRVLSAKGDGRLELDTGKFYILRSKERLALPAGVAAYCRAIDETIGEMRIHYAGFVHPFFGMYRKDSRKGTPLIFEVRGHDLPVSLADGEVMAKLVFYRMSRDSTRSDGDEESYGGQELQLSKFFAAWPENLEVDGDGAVTPKGA